MVLVPVKEVSFVFKEFFVFSPNKIENHYF